LVVASILFSSAEAFSGGAKSAPKKAAVKKSPVKKAPVKKAPVKKAVARRSTGGFSPQDDIGVTPPLGLFDPLGFLSRGPDAYRRYQEIEIKHGRISMMATLGVIVTEAGFRLPGDLATGTPYSGMPGDLAGAYSSVPLAGWVQIVALVAALDIAVFRQDPANEPGDVVQDLEVQWVRYEDPEVKTFKLNVERNNGRAAMLGIVGMISHTALGVDALFPIVQ